MPTIRYILITVITAAAAIRYKYIPTPRNRPIAKGTKESTAAAIINGGLVLGETAVDEAVLELGLVAWADSSSDTHVAAMTSAIIPAKLRAYIIKIVTLDCNYKGQKNKENM